MRWIDCPTATPLTVLPHIHSAPVAPQPPRCSGWKEPTENTELWLIRLSDILVLANKMAWFPGASWELTPAPTACCAVVCYELWKAILTPIGDPAVRSWPRVLTTVCRGRPVNFKSTMKGHTHTKTHTSFSSMRNCVRGHWLKINAVSICQVSSYCLPCLLKWTLLRCHYFFLHTDFNFWNNNVCIPNRAAVISWSFFKFSKLPQILSFRMKQMWVFINQLIEKLIFSPDS